MRTINEDIIIVEVSPESEGLTPVRVNNYFNYMNEDGNLLSVEDFLFVSTFIGGMAVVKRQNGLWNYIKSDGTFLSQDKDFDYAATFIGPVSYVYIDNKWCTIDKSGKIEA